MAMSRQDYVAIAEIIAVEMVTARHNAGWQGDGERGIRLNAEGRVIVYSLTNVAASLADHFARSNSRFDRGRFYSACGVVGSPAR